MHFKGGRREIQFQFNILLDYISWLQNEMPKIFREVNELEYWGSWAYFKFSFQLVNYHITMVGINHDYFECYIPSAVQEFNKRIYLNELI